MSIPLHNGVIELTDDEDASEHDGIKSASDPDNEDEEMVIDDMLTEPSSVHDSSSNNARSSRSPSPETSDSLFTPPPSRKPCRRVILDCVSVPPFSEGMIRADYDVSNASTGKPQQGVEHPSVSHALAAAFALNDRPPSPYLSLKGKERERERPPPAPARSKRKHKPRSEIEYLIFNKRVQRLHAGLHGGLPEMIVEIRGLTVTDNEKEGEPIFSGVLAPLFQERPDIAAALAPYFGGVPTKSSPANV
ncbi:hypothetical protein BDR07DRAFT_1478972 [Suillus spraguei]|nr:hypothetical protein BDR07DRAFT_1478972 [Suillus spraguei]